MCRMEATELIQGADIPLYAQLKLWIMSKLPQALALA